MSKGNETFEKLYKTLDDWLYPPEFVTDGVAHDVDADFNGKIDLADLAVLDKDWGKSLHSGAEDFLGSNELSWEDLDSQGNKTWDNAVFKEQNAFEAYDGFVGSLESPTSNVIGADGNRDANDDNMLGTDFQDII